MLPRAAASTLLGNSLEMQIGGFPPSESTESKAMVPGFELSVLTSLSDDSDEH